LNTPKQKKRTIGSDDSNGDYEEGEESNDVDDADDDQVIENEQDLKKLEKFAKSIVDNYLRLDDSEAHDAFKKLMGKYILNLKLF